ncbi:hypothetical protein B0T24DRAFT_699288 [Lasiosphaeria ovina]|uniref:Major facilitator superfamily (MFS) profile domain-containing protein n=1 Tax=Lasiosphaeria ovina TaxID=92902 RepID=A0AAE0N9V6_9PEZI|nr:hypothetical protein B0T24DRAFT_699288 [Lasiosphaeria ovina]
MPTERELGNFDLTSPATTTSFYGQTHFKEHFGAYDASTDSMLITPEWQTGISNSALVGRLAGLAINGWAQDRFGSRVTMVFFMAWMMAAIFIPVFAPSQPVRSPSTYACDIVPTVLRPYVTSYVCMCWRADILPSSGVVRAVASIDGHLGYKLPFMLQWVWPVALFVAAYFAPESPWNSVWRDRLDEARAALCRLLPDSDDRDREVDAALAYIRHTTVLELPETESANFWECFRGTNLRRTEIKCVVWAAKILCGNAILGYSVAFDVNISLSACYIVGYIVGGIICWFLFPHVGRATIYMSGLAVLFFCLIAIGGLGFASGESAQMAVGVLLVISTLVNMITVGPVCYPIVAETLSGRLRYKTIVIGRFMYNLMGLVTNSITPRMISPLGWNWGAKAGLFYAGINLLCNIWCWFRLPETKGRTFGEIDLLFDNRVPARKFKYTKVDQFAHPDAYEAKLDAKTRSLDLVEDAA